MCQEKKGQGEVKPESSDGQKQRREQLSRIIVQVLEDEEVEIDIGHK
jgi:hypothetical protein